MRSNGLFKASIQESLKAYFAEDDLSRNAYYLASLPSEQVLCKLYIKSDVVLSGLPFFFESFAYLLGNGEFNYTEFMKFEGQRFAKSTQAIFQFQLPFNIALTGERIALNLLQHATSISTFTAQFVEKAEKYKIKILDTRKTTPGLRALEKYAVRYGGGYNHRLGQTDVWMVKDNHKYFFGGVEKAIEFFKKQGGMYTPIELEVHTLNELKEALNLGIKHIMLDNFSPELILEAVSLKKEGITYEVSGGVTLETLENYLIHGIDAISVGALTYGAPPMDLSFKYTRV